jgi:hypothetical protein
MIWLYAGTGGQQRMWLVGSSNGYLLRVSAQAWKG